MACKHASVAFLTALLSVGFSATADLPVPLREAKPELGLVGSATLQWFGVHVYDIALHAPNAVYTTNSAAALSIRYNISIKHQRLLETTLKEWRRMGKAEESQRAQWIRRLDSLWPDLKPGDRLTACRRQDGPTEFYFGDRLLGEVADPAFGPAFFAIWLDPACRHPGVRDGLLGLQRRKKGVR